MNVQCGPFSLTSEERRSVFDLLFDLYTGLYSSTSSQCPLPCATLSYQAHHKSTDVKAEGMDMFIIYDQIVEVSRAQLVINTFTLVNRLGGTVGFCKEILWLSLLVGGIVSLTQHITQMCYFCNSNRKISK